jgi:LytR cell envelope-related transcriptional attenuator
VQPHSWLKFASITFVGLLVGAAIAGRPDRSVSDVRVTVGSAATSSSLPLLVPTSSDSPTTATTATTVVPTTTTVTRAINTTTTAASTTTSTPVALDRGSVRVVMANGTNTVGLGRKARDRMRALGYEQAAADDALGARRDDTVVFVRPGFEAAGALVASDLDLTPDQVMPLLDTRVTSSDEGEDVFVVLGKDWKA